MRGLLRVVVLAAHAQDKLWKYIVKQMVVYELPDLDREIYQTKVLD